MLCAAYGVKAWETPVAWEPPMSWETPMAGNGLMAVSTEGSLHAHAAFEASAGTGASECNLKYIGCF